MKIIENLTLTTLAATLLFQTPITRAGDHAKAVPPSNPFVLLLEGTYGPAGVVRDLGLVLPHLNNGIYVTVPIYNIDSGVPGPTDQAVGSFYALGGDEDPDLVAYDLGKGAPITFDTSFKPGTKPVDVQHELEKRGVAVLPSFNDFGVHGYQNFAITDDAVIFFFDHDFLHEGPGKVSVPRTEIAALLA